MTEHELRVTDALVSVFACICEEKREKSQLLHRCFSFCSGVVVTSDPVTVFMTTPEKVVSSAGDLALIAAATVSASGSSTAQWSSE